MMRTFNVKMRSDDGVLVNADEMAWDAQFVYFNIKGKLSAMVATALVASVMEVHPAAESVASVTMFDGVVAK